MVENCQNSFQNFLTQRLTAPPAIEDVQLIERLKTVAKSKKLSIILFKNALCSSQHTLLTAALLAAQLLRLFTKKRQLRVTK